MSRRIFGNLRMQLICAVLISLVLGVLVFCVSLLLGNIVLEKTVYGPFTEKMTDKQFASLQAYVNTEGISLNDLQKLNSWCYGHGRLYLAIYNDGALIYEFPSSGGTQITISSQDSAGEYDTGNVYILTLKDDVKVQAFLYYFASNLFFFSVTALAFLLAFLAFATCFVLLINRKISYINLLKRELDILSGGDLEYPVTIIGNDEIGELASGIDSMRISILKHQEFEDHMRSANLELITAMSHDLRTPLTSLTAYLEILDMKKYTDEEQLHNLINKSVNQTRRIKHMADKLFEYSFAFTTEWENTDFETVDADQLFQQILEEYAYSLESSGMKVRTNILHTGAHARVNMDLLQRALDNLYSNLLKYADPEEPILISYKKNEHRLIISISNKVNENKEEADNSTGIGLINCRRIIEYHKGSFEARDTEDGFFVNISIPIQG